MIKVALKRDKVLLVIYQAEAYKRECKYQRLMYHFPFGNIISIAFQQDFIGYIKIN